MIVKKLRAIHGWSQEQLAQMCGLNVRTIQRVESGNQASLETLKCLAAVFEVDISTLKEKVTVIDKESDNWKALPWWYRFSLVGAKTRKSLLVIEIILLVLGLGYWFIMQDHETTAILLLGAYIYGWLIRYGDKKLIW